MSVLQHLRADLREAYAGYTRPAEPSGLVRAHMNEMGDDWPAQCKAAWLEKLRHSPLQNYPETQSALEARLGARLGAPPGGVLLGPSSGALLDLLAIAGLAPGDSVAIPNPGFSLYPMLLKRAQAQALTVQVGTGFSLTGFLEAARAGARQLWLTLPNNPTGSGITGELSVPELLRETATLPNPPLVVLDEAYAEFADCTYRLMPDRYPHVVLVRTLSKAYASASLRIGYLVGAPELLGTLGRLQLPYSLTAASLLALEVALDNPQPFAERVYCARERTARLGRILSDAGHQITRSQANFVYVQGNHAPALAQAGVLARALPGTDATRIAAASDDVVARVAKAMGSQAATHATSTARIARPLLVLDIDGVMLDAEASFREAVRRTFVELCPGAQWYDTYFRGLKRLGGFNNDFRLTSALVHLVAQARLAELEAGTLHLSEADHAQIDAGEAQVALRVAHHYASTESLESALISRDELQSLAVPLAILTGRNNRELALAERRLGFQLEAVCDSAPHLRKPSPAGLLQLCDAFNATRVVFVGDTVDDAAALAGARAQRPEVAWMFCGVGPARAEFGERGPKILQAVTLREALPALRAFLLATQRSGEF